MSGSLYELIAIAARYVFAALMVLIVARAWKITIVDSRRAARLRRLSPETGVCGEFLILTGSGRVREGMRFPVIREGMIGSSSKADVRLRSGGVRRTHAYFELTPKGLRLRDHASSRIYNARGEAKHEMLLGDGSKITIGSVEMMLILTVAVSAPAQAPADDLFSIPDDSPVLHGRPARPAPPRPCPHTPPQPREAQFSREIPVSREVPAFRSAPVSREAHIPGETPVFRDASPADNVFMPRGPYIRDTEARYAWRETVIDETAGRPTVVREAPPEDLFMENPLAADLMEDAPSGDIPGWDDPWSAPAKKTVVTRPHVDDPFDV